MTNIFCMKSILTFHAQNKECLHCPVFKYMHGINIILSKIALNGLVNNRHTNVHESSSIPRGNEDKLQKDQ